MFFDLCKLCEFFLRSYSQYENDQLNSTQLNNPSEHNWIEGVKDLTPKQKYIQRFRINRRGGNEPSERWSNKFNIYVQW